MAATETVCPMCGFKNAATQKRCVSCGARLESVGGDDLSADEEHERRHQQEKFEWKWVFVAFGVYVTLQAVFLVALPFVISTYDPQGPNGLFISAAVWFVGGIVVGMVSPGKTFIEPAVGALLAVIPTVAWLQQITDIYQMSVMLYIVGGLIGVMLTLFGAFLGEKIQMSTRGHAKV